MYDNRHNDK